jgi:hypothetical protein
MSVYDGNGNRKRLGTNHKYRHLDVLYIVVMERLGTNHKYTHLDVLYIVVKVDLVIIHEWNFRHVDRSCYAELLRIRYIVSISSANGWRDRRSYRTLD